jgi:SAM-dependent methyltransferase
VRPSPPFQDQFSDRSALYACARPDYPLELFAALAALTPGHGLAWDAGTGNGQAAVGLADHFTRVVATDASAAQLAEARTHDRITYRRAREGESGLPDGSTDLITAAQAAHWFDLDVFYREVLRVLRPGGVLALWCYGLCRITPEVDAVMDRFYRETIGRWWPPERRHVEAGYRALRFPFPELPFPPSEMLHQWTLTDLTAYVGTWSAVAECRRKGGPDPLPALMEDLRPFWGPPHERREVHWHLHGRLGRRQG